MVFNSTLFIVFFAAVLTLGRLLSCWRTKKVFLLAASYFFYAAWNPPFVALLWVSTAVDWFAANALGRARSPLARKGLLAFSLTANLGMLGFFKYGGFLVENFSALKGALGFDGALSHYDIILPAGISFYTFQTLSYTLDVYRGTIRPARSPLDYALYVAFFPQLVAGPVVRAGDFLPQCEREIPAARRRFGWGAALFIFGLFEKEVLADGILAPVAEKVFRLAAPGFAEAWTGSLAFSGQIFFDFSGYSTCAIGAATCLGFSLPHNFRRPYGAVGFSDFWRRWHITLSSWFRDYVYVPLGGGRKGEVRAAANLLITMSLCGLWHGASWGFVLWGALHGAALAVERFFRRRQARKERSGAGVGARRLAGAGATFLCVTALWPFFRAESLADAWALVRAMFFFGAAPSALGGAEMGGVLALMGAVFAAHWTLRESDMERWAEKIPGPALAAGLAVMLAAIAIAGGDERVFLYFQF